MKDRLEKVPEGWKQTKKSSDNDKEKTDSEKDKLIKSLRIELKNKDESLKYVEKLYKGCEEEIHVLQGEKEILKLRVKDLDDRIRLGIMDNPGLPEETEQDKILEVETDDEENDNWKTIPTHKKNKKRQNHSKDKDTAIICSICEQNVLTESELRAHITECHVDQFNCCECDFQANNKLILTKHRNSKHNRTEHQNSGYFDCEECNNQFSDKWTLNNHKRDNHEVKKQICKFYQQDRCSFSAKGCWNSHETNKNENTRPTNREEYKCYSCHMIFNSKMGMMKHRKLKHIEEVSKCQKFQTGDCGFSDKFCWNRHITKHKDPLMHDTNEVENETNQDFHSNTVNLAPPEKRF